MSDAPMRALVEVLQADRKARSPRYPAQALPAARDPQVAAALERHLAAGARLVDVRALPYEATLGLIPIVFELDPPGGVALRRPSVLALVDGRGRAAAVVDGFDPAQPNPHHAPPDLSDAQPFALLDGPAADAMRFSQADLAPAWSRTRAYVRSAAPAFPLGRGAGDEGEDTFCSQSTIRSTALMAIPTISGGLFSRTVDDHQTLTQPDSFADLVADDSVVIDEPSLP